MLPKHERNHKILQKLKLQSVNKNVVCVTNETGSASKKTDEVKVIY